MNTIAEPRIVAFLCTWCSYAGADRAGADQLPIPPGVRIVRVPCTGRVDPDFILSAFAAGADAVMVLACHPGDCHYKEGNTRAAVRHEILLQLLDELGIDRRRCRFASVSAGEGRRFAELVNETAQTVLTLGPAAAG